MYLSISVDGGLAELTLQRPEKRNALNRAMLEGVRDSLADLRERGDVRALLVTAEGPVFCAGADLDEFRALADKAAHRAWIALGLEAFQSFSTFPGPVIAAIQGGAFGGGLEMALHCDMRILGTDAMLALPEVSLGWRPEWGALERLPEFLTPTRSLDMVLTGARVTARQAVDWGLASEACEDPLTRARALSRGLCELPADVMIDVLAALRPQVGLYSLGTA